MKRTQSPGDWATVPGHWLTGCLQQVRHEPLALYQGAWRQQGDFLRIRVLPKFYMYVLAHPAAIEHVLHTNGKNYRKPDAFNGSVRLLTGNGLLTSEGDGWRRQRRLMQPAFSHHAVAELDSLMTGALAVFVDEWDAAASDRTLDVLPEMMRLGLRIASLALLGTDISAGHDAIGRAYRTTFEYVSLKMNGGMLLTPPWVPTARNREFRRQKTLLDQVVMEIIARRRISAPCHDVLGRLLAAQDETSGVGMSDEQLRDEAITLLTAGHETGGAALAWSLHLLAEHPEVQQELYDELRGHLGGRLPSVADLPQLPLATAVFEEAMRLYPPAWGMPREAIAADEVCGRPLPAGATLMLSQLLAHRHPEFWHEPDRFDPTRFLNAQSRAKFAYFPFGGGARICIGNQLAMLEGPLSLATLIARFDFAPVRGQPVVPDATFTLRPKYGLHLRVRQRR